MKTNRTYHFASLLCLLLLATSAMTVAQEAEFGKLSRSYTLQADGSQEYRCAKELTLFTHTAMNSTYGESFIVYNPQFQELKIHASYTKQKDGTIIKTPDNAFVEVLPRNAANAPAWNHLKEMVVVHTGLELGATVYLDYSVLTRPGYLPELDIYEGMEQTSPVKEYTITLTVPDTKPLAYTLTGTSSRATTTTANGQKVVKWTLHNVPALSREPLAVNALQLAASSYASPAEALKVLSAQFNPSGDAQLLTLSETLTEGKSSDQEKLQAILTYVTDGLDSSPLSLRETDCRIRPANDVINSAYATDTEKVNMLLGLLSAAGIKAEAVAAYDGQLPANCCALHAMEDLFVQATADGESYLLTPRHQQMAKAGWMQPDGRMLSLSRAGETVTIAAPQTDISCHIALMLTPEQAEVKVTATVGNAFIPYAGTYLPRFTAGDGNAQVSREKEATTFTYTTTEALTNRNGYVRVSLPDQPSGLAHAPYSNYNSTRKADLKLAYTGSERYTYTIQLPETLELCTPNTSKTLDNAVGSFTFTVKRSGQTAEVVRTLQLKKQLITPADYAAFRSLMTAWVDTNSTQLLLRII